MKSFLNDLSWILINGFVIKIPSWTIRKLLLQLVGLKIGRGSRVGINTVLVHPWKIKIGKNSKINENGYLDGRGGLVINDNCSISIYSKILTATHNFDDESMEYVKKNVTLNNHCFIGMGAIVLPGTDIAAGAIIGAGCVINGQIEEKGIYVGNPAKLVRNRSSKLTYDIKSKSYFK